MSISFAFTAFIMSCANSTPDNMKFCMLKGITNFSNSRMSAVLSKQQTMVEVEKWGDIKRGSIRSISSGEWINVNSIHSAVNSFNFKFSRCWSDSSRYICWYCKLNIQYSYAVMWLLSLGRFNEVLDCCRTRIEGFTQIKRSEYWSLSKNKTPRLLYFQSKGAKMPI